MKFVLVGPAHPHRGGIAQYNTSLYQALASRHETLLISFRRQYPGFLFPGTSQHDGSREAFRVPCEALLDSVGPRSWKAVADRICRFAPDCVVFQWWQPFFGPAYRDVIRRVKSRSTTRILFLCHNIYSHQETPFPGRRRLERALTRRAFARVDGFLVHAQDLVGAIATLTPGRQVRRIYHPVYDFYGRWDGGAVERRDKPRLLFFGKIRPYKGLKTLLEALALVRPRLDFEATIAGEFYTDPRPYKRLAERLGLEGSLIWKDHYIPNEDVPGIFRQADLVVLPYVEATQSGVVPVAYQFGVPVIATRVGGLAEVVREGETGYLVPPRDPEALAGRIVRFFHREEGERFRRNIERFRERLTWDQVVRSILELLDSLRVDEYGEKAKNSAR